MSLEENSEESIDRAISRARDCLLRERYRVSVDTPSGTKQPGVYWVGELEADTTLESDYILFLYFLDPEAHRDKIRKLANYIVRHQLDDGSWNIYYGGPGDISASVKAYFALKLAGYSTGDPLMVKARDAILRMGGAEEVNSYTKIYLSFLNQFDWDEVPAIPPEIVLLPRFFYFNVYEISYWSRAILIPLSIVYAKKANRKVDVDLSIREIFASRNGTKPANGNAVGQGGWRWRARLNGASSQGRRNGKSDLTIPADPNLFSWKSFFSLIDRILKLVEKTPVKPFRNLALKKAEEWMVSRMEDSDGLGAIFPSMVNSVMALHALGYKEDHPHVTSALSKLEELEIEEGDTLRLQPCLSPVWDTALAVNALGEAGVRPDEKEMVEAGRWLVSKEVRKPGDWQLRVPDVEVSGWYFQFQNEFYPDIDDTAAVLMALDRVAPEEVDGIGASIGRGISWIVSMQCSNGGWAAFDVDVDHDLLTKVPYADHNAMLDPACPDITGRILEALSRFPTLRDRPEVAHAIRRGVEFLKANQEADGSWYGRWGVNAIYGTWQALKGLTAVGEDPAQDYIRRGIEFLETHQNPDGGWGESCHSYDDPAMRGRGCSTASQTAWALMGLVAAGEVDSPAAKRGIRYLVESQNEDGNWDETYWTGTGFPSVFYLKYHLYRLYFPLFALGMVRNARSPAPAPQPRTDIELSARQAPVRAARLGAFRTLFGFLG